MGKIREGRWDCSSCGEKGILGRLRECPQCAHTRPSDVNFYLPENAPEVTDRAQQEQARAGADWYCQHCGSGNSDLNDNCTQCGAAKGSSPHHQVEEWRQSKPVEPMVSVSPVFPPSVEQPRGFDLRLLAVPAGIAALVGVMILLVYLFFFRTQLAPATVTGFAWERTVMIEEYRTATEDGWSVPAGGREMSQRQEIHHYDRVLDHYETRTRTYTEQVQTGSETYVCGQRDLGNGYFEDVECTRAVYTTQTRTETYQEPVYRDDPVYQTRYTYEIEKWVYDRTERSAGQDQKAYWPEFSLAGNERGTGRGENYTVYFTDENGEVFTYPTGRDDWLSYQLGEKVQLKLNIFNVILEVIRE